VDPKDDKKKRSLPPPSTFAEKTTLIISYSLRIVAEWISVECPTKKKKNGLVLRNENVKMLKAHKS
jgi:hypothetical protein